MNRNEESSRLGRIAVLINLQLHTVYNFLRDVWCECEQHRHWANEL